MSDPFAQVVSLLKPRTPFSKVISGAGPWRVRRSEAGQPFYCAVVEGACRITLEGYKSIVLEAGDFVLIPSVYNFEMSSLIEAGPEHIVTTPTILANGESRLGTPTGIPDVRSLIGYCVFGSPDAALLVSLLPDLIHVRGERRLTTLLQLVGEEARAQRPARDLVLTRLLEVLFIEALRSLEATAASPGLLRGLADERVGNALRRMHERPDVAWTVPQLAKEAALSRSTFFERFRHAVGVTPMEYLLVWRMALAKDLLRRKEAGVAEVARRVGYRSASTFTIAFVRHVGLPPARYARGD